MYNNVGIRFSRLGNGDAEKSEGLTPFGMTVISFNGSPSEAM
jgi:hypothetical protein